MLSRRTNNIGRDDRSFQSRSSSNNTLTSKNVRNSVQLDNKVSQDNAEALPVMELAATASTTAGCCIFSVEIDDDRAEKKILINDVEATAGCHSSTMGKYASRTLSPPSYPLSLSSFSAIQGLNASIEATRAAVRAVLCVSIGFWTTYAASILNTQFLFVGHHATTIGFILTFWKDLPVLIVFGINLLAFVLHFGLHMRYDTLVRRRHALVSEVSENSELIVREIFPKTVRERILERHRHLKHEQSVRLLSMSSEEQFCNKQRRRRSTGDLPFERSTQHRYCEGDGGHHHYYQYQQPQQQQPDAIYSCCPKELCEVTALNKNSISNGNYRCPACTVSSRPIADNYSCATVLFADIAGFTAWSSNRNPIEVFVLLEHLYAAFDAAATEHGIFKVETIGDSYMAVAGVPDIDQDHAVHMALFASVMLAEFSRVVERLDLSGIRDLNLRIGMNSGPVTAGVLRGRRARFQLFGDTVNTASRMESLGIPGKIQLSQSTADLLLESKKASWLEPRLDPIAAKGKGELRTYWLDIDVTATANTIVVDRVADKDELLTLPPTNTAEVCTLSMVNSSLSKPAVVQRDEIISVPPRLYSSKNETTRATLTTITPTYEGSSPSSATQHYDVPQPQKQRIPLGASQPRQRTPKQDSKDHSHHLYLPGRDYPSMISTTSTIPSNIC